MEPVTRRRALTLAGLGLLGAGASGCGLFRRGEDDRGDGLRPVGGAALREPDERRSRDGVLETSLVAAAGTQRVAGRSVRTLGYEGGVPGPTLHVHPGDVVRLELVNRLEEDTNLHVHGLQVSPEGAGDDVFVRIPPGGTRRYEYRLPDDHPTGIFWYHPHVHGSVADQVFAGLYGAIRVSDPGTPDGPRERVLVVSDIDLDADGRVGATSVMDRMRGREGSLVLVNGQSQPAATARVGSPELWHIVNACCSRYLALGLAGQEATVVGRDAGTLPRPRSLDDVVLAPGNRLQLRVDPAEGAGQLVARPVDRGTGFMDHMGDGTFDGTGDHMGDHMGDGMGPTGAGPLSDRGDVTLLRLDVGPADGSDSDGGEGPSQPTDVRDLREAEVSTRRALTLQMGLGGMSRMGSGTSFRIDGRTFDPDRTDQRAALGTVEEWTIRNDSQLAHPFHLHTWPMQVLSVGGREVADPLWLDVVDVPARSETVVRIGFDAHPGRTVYHCHILDHEDEGMMGTIEVGAAAE